MAVSNKWFESIAIAQKRAKRRLPRSVYGALIAGTGRGVTSNDNMNAFDELVTLPVTAGQPAWRDLSTMVFGQEMAMPVMISPTGVQAVHPDGEVAVARAAAARGVTMGLSSFASKPLTDVIEANPQTYFQIYWAGDRDSIVERIDRAHSLGAKGLIVTLDWSFVHSRDWGSPPIPESIDLRTMVRHAPEVMVRPAWLATWLARRQLPELSVPNFVTGDESPPGFFDAYGVWAGTPPPTWDDIAWLRKQWDGPFMVKGIMRRSEARQAVDAGATAISVSNHGGNNVDGAPGAIRVLPGVADEVGGEVDVVMDGGIRRGSDIVKCLALGADAVMIGRAYLWGLAANGQAGVENVLDVLRDGIDTTMRALGRSSIDELCRDDVVVPDGFTRG